MTQSQTSLSQAELENQLKAIVGDDKVKTDADSLETFGKDWTKIYPPNPSAIVFPKTTEQVQAIVKLANEHQIALVPSGGRTGLFRIQKNQEDIMNKHLNTRWFFTKVNKQASVVPVFFSQIRWKYENLLFQNEVNRTLSSKETF